MVDLNQDPSLGPLILMLGLALLIAGIVSRALALDASKYKPRHCGIHTWDRDESGDIYCRTCLIRPSQIEPKE